MVYLLDMSRYKYKKLYCWTPSIAYLLGIVASDGCLINNGRHINVTSKDPEVIAIVKEILNLHCKSRTKRSGYGGIAFHLQFSDVALYDFLLNTGLTPAKSKTMGELAVPDDLYGHFLRGYFDGDGCIYGFWDVRWKNSLMYYTEFASASPDFLAWMQAKNSELAGVSAGRVKPSTRVMSLSYAKADSKKLYKLMYPEQKLPSLERKKQRFIDLLAADPYPIKE